MDREAQFTRAFFISLKSIEAAIGTRARMRQMIARYDNNVVEAWKHLKSEITYGFFELKQHGLLRYSIEYQMLLPEWRDIFDRNSREEAAKALAEIDPCSKWLARVDENYVLKEDVDASK